MKRLQNKIAESRLTLPITAAYASLVWALGGAVVDQMWMQFACFVLTTYVIVELNTTFVLLRTYSRMVSCVFLCLTCSSPFLFPAIDGGIVALCYSIMYMPLFNGYQDRTSPGWNFYAFLALGVASLLWVQILYFVPLMWIFMVFSLRSMSWRTFFASLLGLITPYWFASLWFIFTEDIATPIAHFTQLTEFMPLYGETSNLLSVYESLGASRCLTFAVVTPMLFTGIIHYLRKRQNDKLNTRMYYSVFIVNTIAALTLTILQPQHFDFTFRMAIVSGSPAIAHFLTHTRTFITNISFFVMLTATVALTIVNLLI